MSPPLPRSSETLVEEINRHIGRVMRRRRRLLEMTQADVARSCGVSFQQVQKYECGVVALSAERLWRMACALGVDITYFYEGLPSLNPRTEQLAGA